MYAYLSIYIIYPIINNCFKSIQNFKYFLIFLCIVIFSLSILPQTIDLLFKFFNINGFKINNITKMNPFGTYSHMLLYFIIGGFLYKYNLYKKYNEKKWIIRVTAIALIVTGIIGLVMIKRYWNGTFEWKGIYLTNGYKWISTMLLSVGIFILFQGICINVKIINKLLSEIGTNTIGIFYLHVLILSLIKKEAIIYRGTLINIVKTLIVIIICYTIAKAVKKIPILRKLVS